MHSYLVIHLEDPQQLVLGRFQLRRVHRHHVLHEIQIPALVLVKYLEKTQKQIM